MPPVRTSASPPHPSPDHQGSTTHKARSVCTSRPRTDRSLVPRIHPYPQDESRIPRTMKLPCLPAADRVGQRKDRVYKGEGLLAVRSQSSSSSSTHSLKTLSRLFRDSPETPSRLHQTSIKSLSRPYQKLNQHSINTSHGQHNHTDQAAGE